jgi:DnaD/phage-associated family protein
MADFRNIHTRIWTDSWFCELPADAKLLFIYLFSNPNASVCGMYELPKRNISIDTGLTVDRVSAILDTFSAAGKVHYEAGIVWVVNLKKYNDAGDSSKVAVRIRKDLDQISDCPLKRRYYEYNKIPYPQSQIPYPEKGSETERRQNQKETGEDQQPPRPNIYKVYENEIGNITNTIAEELDDALKMFSEEYIVDALKEAAKQNKRNWKYALAILTRWKADGRSNGKVKELSATRNDDGTFNL